MPSNTNIARRLGEKAVAARVKRAAMFKQAEPDGVASALTPANVPQFDIGKLLGQAGETAGNFWGSLSPEQQYALGGAGLGGAYGAMTHRPGHFLEDTAYGAGIGGLGGYGTGLVANNWGALKGENVGPKSPEEEKAEWLANRDAQQAKIDSPEGAPPKPSPLVPAIQGATNDIVNHAGVNGQTAVNAGLAVAGGNLAQQGTIAAMHNNPMSRSTMKNYWSQPTKGVQADLNSMGIPASLPKPDGGGKPSGFPTPGTLPMPNTTAGLKTQAYNAAVTRNADTSQKWQHLANQVKGQDAAKRQAWDTANSDYDSAMYKYNNDMDRFNATQQRKYDYDMDRYNAETANLDASHAKAMADYQRRVNLSRSSQVSPLPLEPVKPTYPTKPVAPTPPPKPNIELPSIWPPRPTNMPPAPAGSPLPPKPNSFDQAAVRFSQLSPGQKRLSRGVGVAGAVATPVLGNMAARNIPESWTKAIGDGVSNWGSNNKPLKPVGSPSFPSP